MKQHPPFDSGRSFVSQAQGKCKNHLERDGIGICISCRQVFCSECVTKIDGVNYCEQCLGKPATSRQQQRHIQHPAPGLVSTNKSLTAQRLLAYSTILIFFFLVGSLFFLISLSPAFWASLAEKG